jgi:hypothetical protein
MLKQLKQTSSTILLTSTVLFTQTIYAQVTSANAILDAIRDMLTDQQEKNEAVEREIAQDMKQYMGLLNLKDLETQNVMRLMLSPFFDSTVTMGTRIFEAEKAVTTFQKDLNNDTANYNLNTPLVSDDTFLLGKVESMEKANQDAEALTNASSGILDDLLATTLLSGYAFTDDAQAADAYRYVQRITNKDPLPPPENIFQEDGITPTEEGRKFLISAYDQLPTMSLAQLSLLEIVGEKQRFAGFAKGLPIGNPEDGSASLMEVMAYEVERRYMSEDWYDAMNQMSTEALLREIAYMIAAESYLQFKNYERGQRIEAMLASQMGIFSALMNTAAPPNPDELTQDTFQ